MKLKVETEVSLSNGVELDDSALAWAVVAQDRVISAMFVDEGEARDYALGQRAQWGTSGRLFKVTRQ